MKHLISLFDLNRNEVVEILELAHGLKARHQSGDRPALLAGRMLGLMFEKPSLRTRVSFEAAMTQLGGNCVFLSSGDAGLKGREALADVARVMSSYTDAVVLRTFSQQLIADFAAHSRCPVINGLTDESHPCQALTDLLTIEEELGSLAGKRVAYIGDGNNVASSLAIAAAYVDMSLVVCSPAGYELSDAFLSELKRRIPAADVTLTSAPQQAVKEADVVYTDVWASMGQEDEAEQRERDFADYQVNGELMSHAPPGCRFMHDLPERRGLEVTDEVIDGPESIAFQQAENRMHLAKGLLAWLLK